MPLDSKLAPLPRCFSETIGGVQDILYTAARWAKPAIGVSQAPPFLITVLSDTSISPVVERHLSPQADHALVIADQAAELNILPSR